MKKSNGRRLTVQFNMSLGSTNTEMRHKYVQRLTKPDISNKFLCTTGCCNPCIKKLLVQKHSF